MRTKLVKLKDLLDGSVFLGKDSFYKLEENLKNYFNQDITCVVDVRDVVINDKLTLELARLKVLYGCEFIGLDDRTEVLDAYIDTYYFVKKALGRDGYKDWMIRRIQEADYPLMIKDNRLSKRVLQSDMEIIQPIYVNEHTSDFSYKKIKSYYTEPINLMHGIKNGVDVFEQNSIPTYDLGLADVGVRFASNESELTTILLLKNILDHNGELVV